MKDRTNINKALTLVIGAIIIATAYQFLHLLPVDM